MKYDTCDACILHFYILMTNLYIFNALEFYRLTLLSI
jgi:hypothetical protein